MENCDGEFKLTFGESRVADDSFLSRDREMTEWQTALPHIHQEGTEQFLKFRLSDSLPQVVLNEIRNERKIFEESNPKPWPHEVEMRSRRLYNDKVNGYLDLNYGSCLLQDPAVAGLFEQSLLKEHNASCELVAYVIMPNHAHVLMLPYGQNNWHEIITRVMGRAAYLINKHFGRRTIGWSKEVFDRMIRDADHHDNAIRYILKNWEHGGVICNGTHIVIKRH